MSAILKFDFQKKKKIRFSEVNYLNLTKRPNFACDNYIFPKTKVTRTSSGRILHPLTLVFLRGGGGRGGYHPPNGLSPIAPKRKTK